MLGVEAPRQLVDDSTVNYDVPKWKANNMTSYHGDLRSTLTDDGRPWLFVCQKSFPP